MPRHPDLLGLNIWNYLKLIKFLEMSRLLQECCAGAMSVPTQTVSRRVTAVNPAVSCQISDHAATIKLYWCVKKG
jgi:hypothetical protein